MYTYKILTGVIVSIALISSPNTLFAEEPAPTEVRESPRGERPLPPAMMRQQMEQASTTQKGGGGMQPRVQKLLPQEGVPKTSNASGTRLATGTRPIAPEMRREIEHRDEMRDKMMLEGRMGTRTPTMPGKINERIQQAKDQRSASRGEMMKIFAEKTGERLQAAIERLEKLSQRLSSRVAKLRSAGKDTSATEGHLTSATASIDKAKTLIAEAKNLASSWTPPTDSNVSSSTPANERSMPGLGAPSPMREPFKKAGEELKNAHRELILAIESLKLLGGDTNIRATGTQKVIPPPTQSTTTSGINN